MVLRNPLLKVLVHGENHGRCELLGAESESSAVHANPGALLKHCGAYIEVEGLAEGAGLLRPVEDGDSLCGLGDGCNESVCAEGAEQADLDKAVLLSHCVELVDGLLNGLASGTHADDDLLCIRSSNVIKQVVASAALS